MSESENSTQQKSSTWFALGLIWQLGYTIAIPLVVFGLLGRFLDKKFGTSPWMLLAGILFSLIVSTIGVYRKTMVIMKSQLQSSNVKPSSKLKIHN